jgi:2-dehydro-3-deoxygluconokinase
MTRYFLQCNDISCNATTFWNDCHFGRHGSFSIIAEADSREKLKVIDAREYCEYASAADRMVSARWEGLEDRAPVVRWFSPRPDVSATPVGVGMKLNGRPAATMRGGMDGFSSLTPLDAGKQSVRLTLLRDVNADKYLESSMPASLNIPKSGELDFLSLGALVHRLDPGIVPFRKASECRIHVSGGEFNVAANLADCFRMKTGIASAMVDYPIGDLAAERVRAMGVKPFFKHFAHDGVTGPNIATVYSDRGYGIRAPMVFYNRSNEAGARLKPGDFDWPAIFDGGIRWFHSGGIFAALSQTTPEVIIEGMQAAKAAGAVVSFDLNFREKLWKISGGLQRAHEVIRRIMAHVDVLVGNEEDLQKGLGIPGPELAAKSKLDPSTFFSMIDNVVKLYPHVKIVATTLREVHSTNQHTWGAVAWVGGKTHVSLTCELDVHDRVGGGDGFAAGFFYGLLTGESPEEALKLGWAHGALLTTFPGDTTMATLEQVKALAQGGSARIQR